MVKTILIGDDFEIVKREHDLPNALVNLGYVPEGDYVDPNDGYIGQHPIHVRTTVRGILQAAEKKRYYLACFRLSYEISDEDMQYLQRYQGRSRDGDQLLQGIMEMKWNGPLLALLVGNMGSCLRCAIEVPDLCKQGIPQFLKGILENEADPLAKKFTWYGDDQVGSAKVRTVCLLSTKLESIEVQSKYFYGVGFNKRMVLQDIIGLFGTGRSYEYY